MERFTFRRLTRADFPLLARWLAEPHVARWWDHEFSPDAIERDFGSVIDGHVPSQDYVVELAGEPLGFLQYCHIHDFPEYVEEMDGIYPVGPGTASIDYFIGEPERVGAGLGTAMIASFVERVWVTDPTAARIVVPVNSANIASWRALMKAGFTLVTRGEMVPDNPADDRMHEVLQLDRPAGTGSPSPRFATVDDATEVARLLHDFNTEFDTPTPGVEVLRDRLRRLLAGESVLAIIAGVPAVAVGLVTIRPNVWYEGSVALLDELYVIPQMRSQGIGAAMLDLLHKHAKENGIDAIEINVDEADVDAQRFYERHGYSSLEPDTNERAFYYFQDFSRRD